jgi:hypothetical protein
MFNNFSFICDNTLFKAWECYVNSTSAVELFHAWSLGLCPLSMMTAPKQQVMSDFESPSICFSDKGPPYLYLVCNQFYALTRHFHDA